MSDIVERLRSHDDCLLQPIRRDVKEAADEIERLRAENERLKQEPELLRAELISLANAARNALADAYDRAKESKP